MDSMNRASSLLLALLLGCVAAYGADGDGDGIDDALDNCLVAPNPPELWQRRLTDPGHDVGWQLLSPDGLTLVYSRLGVPGLYSMPVTGGAATVLHGTNVVDLKGEISPDSSRVVFFVASAGGTALRSASLAGGPSVDLVAHLACYPWGSDCFEISSDGTWVVSTSDQPGNDALISVPITGGASNTLNAGVSGVVQEFQISPDGATVVFRAGQRLYRAPITGGAAGALSDPLPSGHSIKQFRFSPDGLGLVYVVDLGWPLFPSVLYQVSLAGGPPMLLTPPLPPDRGGIWSFAVSSDSTKVVYHSDQTDDGTFELFSVPIFGGASTTLNEPLLLDESLGGEYKITPDSTTVVYGLRRWPLEGMLAVPIGGGPSVPLAEAMGQWFEFSPDGTQVIYIDPLSVLRSVPVGGGSVPVILGDAAASYDYPRPNPPPTFGADGTSVFYLASVGQNGIANQLDRTSIAGGPPVTLAGPVAYPASIPDFVVSAVDSTVYLLDRGWPSTASLYSPTVSQADNDLDGLGDACDNCAWSVNVGQENADGDVYGDACDCAVGDASVWALPGAVTAHFVDREHLVWQPATEPGAVTVVYDVMRSSARDFFVMDGSYVDPTCLEVGQTDTEATILEQPQAGQVFYYVVRVRNACGENTGQTSWAVPYYVLACP